jgi:hypothetical protein
MNITSAQYQNDKSGNIDNIRTTIDGTEMFVAAGELTIADAD